MFVDGSAVAKHGLEHGLGAGVVNISSVSGEQRGGEGSTPPAWAGIPLRDFSLQQLHNKYLRHSRVIDGPPVEC